MTDAPAKPRLYLARPTAEGVIAMYAAITGKTGTPEAAAKVRKMFAKAEARAKADQTRADLDQ
jgi:hypothetical protein